MEVTPHAPILTTLAAIDFLINSYPNTYDLFAIAPIVPYTYFRINEDMRLHLEIFE